MPDALQVDSCDENKLTKIHRLGRFLRIYQGGDEPLMGLLWLDAVARAEIFQLPHHTVFLALSILFLMRLPIMRVSIEPLL